MRRPGAFLAVALALVALAACSGDDDKEATTNPAPSEPPSGDAPPPSPSGLPPELVQCFAERGFDVRSPTAIHSAPPQVVQECFGALHQGGGPP